MFIRSIETAQKIGFQNISIDLMYSLPGQTIQQIKTNLGHVIHFGNNPFFSIFPYYRAKDDFLSVNEQREVTYT